MRNEEKVDATKPKKKKANQKKRNLQLFPGNLSYQLLYACPVSYNVFTRLLEHAKTHTSKENFFCEVCKKDFPSMKAAMRHIHGRKTNECCSCGKTYRNSALLMHHRLHTGEKPSKCGYCSSRFNQKSTQSIHERTQTGERPYSCKKCSDKFISGSALRRHMKRKHPSEKK